MAIPSQKPFTSWNVSLSVKCGAYDALGLLMITQKLPLTFTNYQKLKGVMEAIRIPENKKKTDA